MKFLRLLLEILLIYPRIWIGWISVILRVLQALLTQFLLLSKWKQIFLVLTLLQIFFAIRPWIEYSVEFLDQKETLQISIKSNLWILLFLGLNFLGNLLFLEKLFYYNFFLHILVTSIIGVGIFYPNLLFTNFLKTEDYSYSMNFYIFLSLHFTITVIHIIYLLSYRKTKHETSYIA